MKTTYITPVITIYHIAQISSLLSSSGSSTTYDTTQEVGSGDASSIAAGREGFFDEE